MRIFFRRIFCISASFALFSQNCIDFSGCWRFFSKNLYLHLTNSWRILGNDCARVRLISNVILLPRPLIWSAEPPKVVCWIGIEFPNIVVICLTQYQSMVTQSYWNCEYNLLWITFHLFIITSLRNSKISNVRESCESDFYPMGYQRDFSSLSCLFATNSKNMFLL